MLYIWRARDAFSFKLSLGLCSLFRIWEPTHLVLSLVAERACTEGRWRCGGIYGGEHAWHSGMLECATTVKVVGHNMCKLVCCCQLINLDLKNLTQLFRSSTSLDTRLHQCANMLPQHTTMHNNYPPQHTPYIVRWFEFYYGKIQKHFTTI